MSTDPREFEHTIDGTGGTVTAPTSPLVDVIAEILAYEHCKRVNPKADHPIMGYHTFHPDQREHLRGAQMDVARAVLAAISEAGAVEWATEHVAQGSRTIEIHPCDSEADAQGAIAYYGGRILSRITGPWERAE